MHPNPVYHTADDSRNLGFARERGFGVISINGEDGPLMAHVPFLLAEDGKSADFHLMRSNPIARTVGKSGPARAVIAVSGSDSYVSPDWYGIEDQVPTWNYVAVHLRGTLEPLPAEALPDVLERLSDAFETRLLPKPIWKTGKVSAPAMEKMMRIIQPFRMKIGTVDGTWKLSQNKPDPVRLSAAEHMEGYGFGSEPRLLAALMRGAGKE